MLCCHSLAQIVLPLFKLKHRLQPAIYLKKTNPGSFPIYTCLQLLSSPQSLNILFFVLKDYFKIF